MSRRRKSTDVFHRLIRIGWLAALALAGAAAAGADVSRGEVQRLLERDGPASAQVLAGYDTGGFDGAMAAYRACRAKLPKARLYHVYPARQDPVGAARKLMTEGMSAAGHPPFPIKPPVSWGADPYGDENWKFQLNSLEWLIPVADTFAQTGESGYLDFAVAVAADWHRQNVEMRIPNAYAWYDMATGQRAPVIAFLVDAGARAPTVSDADLWALLQAAARHAGELGDPRKIKGDYNHALYQMLGLVALCRTLPELEGFPQYGEYARAGAERIIRKCFSDEGVHLEHSPQYQWMLTGTLEVVTDQGMLDFPGVAELHQKAQQSLAWMVQPMGYLARMGDTSLRQLAPHFLPLDAPARSPQLKWAMSKGEAGQPPSTTSWVAPKGGYAVFRSTWTPAKGQWDKASYLILAAGRHSRVHKHADDFTFEWSELGKPLVIDSGMYKYQPNDPKRQYCMSTHAHNTVEIDGRDYETPSNMTPTSGSAITKWTSSGEVRAIEAQVTHFGDVQHRRTLVFAPSQWLLVVDEMSSTSSHSYTQWFHIPAELDLSKTRQGARAQVPGTGRDVVIASSARPSGSEVMVKGQEQPRLEGWTSYETGTFVPAWALGFSTRGKEAVFATVLALPESRGASQTSAPIITVSADQFTATWTAGGKEITVSVGRGGKALTVHAGGAAAR